MCTGIVFLASLLPIFLPSLSPSLSCSGVEVNTYCRCSNNPPSPSLALRRSQPVSRIFPLFPCDSARSDSRSVSPIYVPSFPIPYKPFSVSFRSFRILFLTVYTVAQFVLTAYSWRNFWYFYYLLRFLICVAKQCDNKTINRDFYFIWI